ncbi:MAG: AarF/ABC1/UbiB kinase family protein [Bdellovibrionaceae bacterium]|nr:AarF/ABC1/UbiB kinase family protein [Pseudobdellovibrionaceae bacterium]
MANTNGKKLDRIKSNIFSRTVSLAKFSLNAGAGLAGQGLTKIFKSEEAGEIQWNQFIAAQAENFSKEIGELKGSIMKAGQMLSMYGEHFFPPEVNKYFKTLQQDSPALKWEAIEPLIIKYLGAEKYHELDVDHEPLACASLGQVHRAVIKKTKESVVLKVQYPKVDKAIDSDLRAIRTFIQLLKILPQDTALDPVFEEIKEMLLQESDYEQEAKKTMQFYERVKDDPRFIVPKIYPEFSNKRILTSSFERGLRLEDDLIQSLSQERRNQLAQNFLDLYFQELFIWKDLQTDPHAGNYKIRLAADGKDQWVLFDFGATRSYSDSFLNAYHRMIKGSLVNNPQMLRAAAKDLKFIYDHDDPLLIEKFEEFCIETVEPFLEAADPRQKGPVDEQGNYDWKTTDLPQRLSKRVLEIIKNFKWRTPPREILFLDRKTGGVFIIMSLLKAKMNSRPTIMKYLNSVHANSDTV